MQHSDITRTVYKVSDFVGWQRNGNLQLSPSFQRRPVWKAGAKSYLIDTIIRGLPMPVIFLRELPVSLVSQQGQREVVDGQQRIRTILSYIAPDCLSDYIAERDEFVINKSLNKELAGKRFKELESRTQRQILDYPFVVSVFPSSTADRDVLQIFARMNSTGTDLNAQELRNAAFFGEFKTLAYKLASEQLDRWRSWRVFSEYKIARMDEVELTSELFQLMIEGIGARTKASLDNIYKDYDETFPASPEIERRFHHIMDVIADQLASEMPEFVARRPLFYCLYAAVYDEAYGIGSALTRKKPSAISESFQARIVNAADRILSGRAPEKVLDAAARRTTHSSSRSEIIKYLKK